MSDDEVPDMPHEEVPVPEETAPESVTKPKKKGNWEFTPARKAALEKAHLARAEKAAEKKKLKAETQKKALEIIEDRRIQTTAEDDKLDHVLYELEKIKKHVTATKETIQPELKKPTLRRSRKKATPPDTESDLTESDYVTTETESLPPPRRKNNPPAERSEDYNEPKINIMFG
jgi:small-conductance mechanosensitive channel